MAKGVGDLVVYVERKQISFYGGPFEKITILPLEEKLVYDLEVVDKNALIEAISSLVDVPGVSANLIIVFSDSTAFFKDLGENLTREELDEEEKSFYSDIPFDEPAIKIVKMAKGYKAVAVNGEIYRVIVEALVPKGFKLIAVIPAITIPKFDQKAGLSDKVGSTITSKIDSFKTDSFFQGVTKGERIKTTLKNPESTVGKSKRLAIFIGVFLLLLLALIVLILKRRQFGIDY